jgi:hypothetical protein
MKQTAVEFLVKEISDILGVIKIEPIKDLLLVDAINKAKEMEKEQMRDASCPFIGGWEDDEFEYWYNEKYKK